MTRAEVLNRLQNIFDNVFFDPVTVTPELCAQEIPEWDSLMHITLVVQVEAAFKIRFAVGEVSGTKNVGEFADLIIRKSMEAAA